MAGANRVSLLPGHLMAFIAIMAIFGQVHSGTIIGTNMGGSPYASAVMGLAACAGLNTPWYPHPAMPVLSGSTSYVGLRNGPGTGYLSGSFTSTEMGCVCEGWGVSGTLAGAAYSVWANEALGSNCNDPHTLSSSNTSTVIVATDRSNNIRTTHAVAPSKLPDASKADGVFVADVTITNLNPASPLKNLRYRRVMDW